MRRPVLLALGASAALAGAVQAQEWKEHGRYPTIPMDPAYGTPGGPSYDKANGVVWFEIPAEREPYRVEFRKGPNGNVLLYINGGHLLDTRLKKADGTIEVERALFVMDAEGQVYAIMPEWFGWDRKLGPKFVHHSTIPAGKALACAGEMEVIGGEIRYLNNESGHYVPSNRMLSAAIHSLEEKGVPKGSYLVDFKAKFDRDYPGIGYIDLDPGGQEKIKDGRIKPPSAAELADPVFPPARGDQPPPPTNDEGLLRPEESVSQSQLDAARRAALRVKFEGKVPFLTPTPPPNPAVVKQFEEAVLKTPLQEMTIEWMRKLYKTDPGAAKLIGQIMADNMGKDGVPERNAKMGQLRKQMDLMVWKDILSKKNITVELTNQGKSNGIRSDLDYTLYHLAEENGLTIEQLIELHNQTWKALHEGIDPEQLEIKVMNGDEFYPDWRNESLSEWDYQATVAEILGRLRGDKEKYYVPGGNKQQVHNNALAKGRTEKLRYDPALDKPEIPIEKQVIEVEGETRDLADRYADVYGQYNHMNALGNLVQNTNEYLHHTGNNAQDIIRRAKYANRIVNEGLGNLRFFANNYQQIWASKLPNREELLNDYIKKTFGLLTDDAGRPLLNDAELAKFRKTIDISMQLEFDKTNPTPGDEKGFDTKLASYLTDYRAEAEAWVNRELENQEVKPELREKFILAEQQSLFELSHRRMLAEAMLAGLRHSVARDLTPEGILRNRVRFNPITNEFRLEEPTGARKVARERGVEVALFYELVNGLKDPDLRIDLKKRALASAPDIETAEFYGFLDRVNGAEIDRYIKQKPEGLLKRKIEDLVQKQEARALELAVERKERLIASIKGKGVAVDPATVPPEAVRDEIVDNRLWGLTPEQRAAFSEGVKAMGTKLSGDFREAFSEHASALMLGSSAVNIARAYQAGGAEAAAWAAASEMVWYTPTYIQTPWMVVDLLRKVREGKYADAAWSGGVWVGLARFPVLGNALLAYNIVTGLVDLVHTHYVTQIDADMTEQVFKSRPRDENGGPLQDGKRARPNRMPDAKERIGNGSPPWFPLFYGRYKNEHATTPVAEIDGVKYSDGTVPQDFLSDDQLADSAAIEFAPTIDSILTASGLQPGSPDWITRAWQLKQKYGFDIPYYRRLAKVYDEKYQWVPYYHSPRGINPDYLRECRLDVYDWYARQIGPSGQTGYHDDLRGDIPLFTGDQTEKMEERFAQQCAIALGQYHDLRDQAETVNAQNLAAFKTSTSKAFDAERGLLAAKQALSVRIENNEEKATKALEQQALDLAQQHQTAFVIRYPYTYATQELLPNLEFVARTLISKIKEPLRVTLEEEFLDLKEGAPDGWTPGEAFADKFKPDKDGWTELRPITASVHFTAHLLNADSVEVSKATLDLPMVFYEPAAEGSLGVTVYQMGEKGDSSYYNGALVTLDTATHTTGPIYGGTSFGRLKPGSYKVTVTPSKGDERHGPGNGSATIVDALLSTDPKAKANVEIIVKLPYIPEKKIADSSTTKTNPPPGGDKSGNKPDSTASGGKKPGGKTTKDSTATKDSTGAKGKNDSTAVKQPTAEELIAKLPALTSQAEAARKAAIAACNYTDAVAAQEQVVAAAKDFLAKAFPNGAPPDVLEKAEAFETELAVLKKAAAGAEAAKVHIREARAAVQAKHGEPALTALEAAINTPDIPPCLREQAQSLYDEIKSDLEKRMKLIDQAVEAANDRCDYVAALKFGQQVEAEDPNLSWVTKELPRIKDLARRQKSARDLAAQAEGKAQQAEGLAQNGGDMAQANALFDEALQLAQQALAAAPACEKENLKSLMDLPARKAALSNPKVDQSLVLLLDTSGSMADNNKMENAKSAATDAVKSLGPTTEVALISYDGGCAGGWRINQAFTTNHQSVISAIAMLHPGGGTPTAPAIGFAHDYLEKNGRGKAGQIMLMTDGQNDCGSMVDAGAGLRRSTMPVQIDAVGFGLGTDSKAQQDLGDLVRAAGNGNAYNANDAKELISAFRRAFITSQIRPRDPFVTGDAGAQLSQLFAAAVEFLKQNNLRSAVDQFKTATDKFPNSSAAAYNASLAYEASGQPLQAMNYAKKYLQLAPNAFDAGQVGARIDMLEKEQAANPRAIYSPTDCNTLYGWAQRESRVGGMDAVRKAKVFDILTTAQRGDCAAAQAAYDKYTQQYGKRP